MNMYVKTERHPDLPPPPLEAGPLAWMRKNLFSSPLNALLTIVGMWLLWTTLPPVLNWAILNANWSGNGRTACEALPGEQAGACWVFIKVRLGVLFYGFYPEAERWRIDMAAIQLFASLAPLIMISLVPGRSERLMVVFPVAGVLGVLALCGPLPGLVAAAFLLAPSLLCRVDFSRLTARIPGSTAVRLGLAAAIFFGTRAAAREFMPSAADSLAVFALALLFLAATMGKAGETRWRLALLTLVFPFIGFWLLLGDAFGLVHVPTDQWGGMSLTLIIASFGMSTSLPLGILLALGRRSDMPVIRSLCVAYIEFIRGVPLISVLFMASVMLPLMLPPGTTFDKLLRALVGISIFYAAYMAEVIRGGLQALPKGQFEAAEALGFRYWRAMRLIIMPQALRVVIPGITNTFLGLFKDTTLVAVINLMDILGVVKSALADSQWLGFTKEGYLFAGFAFWVFCFGISSYSMQLEKRLKVKR
jgi:general L-amino acid transport system permease protein